MTYNDFEQLITSVRLARYKYACSNNKKRTLKLYKANVRLSGALLEVLGIFEVVLRNKIDKHFSNQYSKQQLPSGWLLESILPGGFLTKNGCQNSVIKINQAYTVLGNKFTHDRLVATLSFGFWKYLFKGHQYMAGGNTLLKIFPQKPSHTNQKTVFEILDNINELRNRVAHPEPICFTEGNIISTIDVRRHFKSITDLLDWMGINSNQLFIGLDDVLSIADFIDKI